MTVGDSENKSDRDSALSEGNSENDSNRESYNDSNSFSDSNIEISTAWYILLPKLYAFYWEVVCCLMPFIHV